MYVAVHDGDVVARGSFYGPPTSEPPVALDHFDIRPGLPDPVGVGAALLREMYDAVRGQDLTPDLHMFLPPSWRESPDADAISARIAAAEQAGLAVLVERHRFEWFPTATSEADTSAAVGAVPASEPAFTTEPVDDVVIDLLRAISAGSLDAGTRRSVEQLGVDGAALSYFHDMDPLPAGPETCRAPWAPAGAP